ncbi:hypothetical protein [Terrabacter terrae]|uniref:hypothetical protein n=1 Tax=Terrabacter terrae TaxID=318434 RepID=UPI0031DE5830
MATRFTTLGDIVARLPEVDDLDAADRAKTDQPLEAALSMARPVNWWGTGASQDLLRAARDEGLPLWRVPRREIIRDLNAVADAHDRLSILQKHRDQILEDCEAELAYCDDEQTVGSAELAERAIRAIQSGHHEAGMALAVSLGEPLAVWASTPRVTAFDSVEERDEWEAKRKSGKTGGKYRYAQIEIDRLPPGDVLPWDFNYQVLIAPIPRFFTGFWPRQGKPAPKGLSRHVVAHQPTPEHFSRSNALLSVMLVASILRAQQDWIEENR